MSGAADRDTTLALWVVAMATLLRLGIALAVPLVPDETDYWDWSRHLEAGYYDHSPGIAWLIKAGTVLFGDNRAGVRLPAAAAGLVTSLATVLLARRMGGGRAALWAALLLAAMPISGIGLLLVTPDAPLFTCIALGLLAYSGVFAAPPGSHKELRAWLLTGLAMGGALLSKYSAPLVGAGLALAILLLPRDRARLARPAPYLGGLVSFILFLPVVWWNYRRDWISIGFQIEHGFSSSEGSWLDRELRMLGGQAGVVTPVLFVMMAIAVVRALRDREDRLRFAMSVVAAVTYGAFVLTALRAPVLENWPALAYVAGAVVLAAHPWGKRGRRWLVGGTVFAGALVLLVFVQALVPILPLAPSSDPMAEAYGWREVAREVDVERQALSAAGCETAWAAGNKSQVTSQIAFHLPDQPMVFSLNIESKVNQYDLWPRFPDLAKAGDCLVVVVAPGWQSDAITARLAPAFAAVVGPRSIQRRRGDRPLEELWLWQLRGYTGDRAAFGPPLPAIAALASR